MDPSERSQDPDDRADPVHEGQPVLSDPRPELERLDPQADPGAGGRLWRLRVSGVLSRRRGKETQDGILANCSRYFTFNHHIFVNGIYLFLGNGVTLYLCTRGRHETSKKTQNIKN